MLVSQYVCKSWRALCCGAQFFCPDCWRGITCSLLYPMDWNWNGMKICWHLTVLLKCWRHLWVCPRASADASRYLCKLSWVLLHTAASLESDSHPSLQVWPTKVTMLSTNTSFAHVSGQCLPSRSNAAGWAIFRQPELLPDWLFLWLNDLFKPFCYLKEYKS